MIDSEQYIIALSTNTNVEIKVGIDVKPHFIKCCPITYLITCQPGFVILMLLGLVILYPAKKKKPTEVIKFT